jgi:hypothetical protein
MFMEEADALKQSPIYLEPTATNARQQQLAELLSPLEERNSLLAQQQNIGGNYSFQWAEGLATLKKLMDTSDEAVDTVVRETIERNQALLHQLVSQYNLLLPNDHACIKTLLCSQTLHHAVELISYLQIIDSELLIAFTQQFDTLYKEGVWLFNNALFKLYTQHIWYDTMRTIFSHTEDPILLEQRNRIITYCTNLSFPSGHFSRFSDYFKLGNGREKPHEPHFLWWYASEVQYLHQQFGISLATLFALDKDTLGRYCGTVRTLCNGRNEMNDTWAEIVTFDMSNTPSNVTPEQMCTIASLHYAVVWNYNSTVPRLYPQSRKRVSELFTFLQTHSTLPTLPSLISLSPNKRKHTYNVQASILVEQRNAIRQARREKEQAEREAQLAEIKRKGVRHGRNYKIITALAHTLGETHNLLPAFLWTTTNTSSELLKAYSTYTQALAHKYAGLYSIGGKIHFPHAIPEEKIRAFEKTHNLSSSPFKLIHANTSLLLPPTNFPEELQFMIRCMYEAWLIDADPQLQIAIPGRLPNELWALLGSSMILLSEQHVEYTPESFETTHMSSTGRRMVTYDAWCYDDGFLRNSEKITWRTDVLLLKDVNLIPKAK